MIEIPNPDLTPFDNLIPDFQAGKVSPAITGRQAFATIEHPTVATPTLVDAYLMPEMLPKPHCEQVIEQGGLLFSVFESTL